MTSQEARDCLQMLADADYAEGTYSGDAIRHAIKSLTPPPEGEITEAMRHVVELIEHYSEPLLYYGDESETLTDVQEKALRPVGFWSQKLETSVEEGLPFPVSGTIPPRLKRRLVEYLRSGRACAHYRGLSQCRLCSNWKNGAADLTDGVWVWPEGLSHYVDKHDVGLPEEFIQHAVPEGDAEPTTWKERDRWRYEDHVKNRNEKFAANLKLALRALWHYRDLGDEASDGSKGEDQ